MQTRLHDLLEDVPTETIISISYSTRIKWVQRYSINGCYIEPRPNGINKIDYGKIINLDQDSVTIQTSIYVDIDNFKPNTNITIPFTHIVEVFIYEDNSEVIVEDVNERAGE
jgi:hypothetical protein